MCSFVSRYPLSYEHVTELVAERGVEVDASCIWRWVQAYAPEWVFLKFNLWAAPLCKIELKGENKQVIQVSERVPIPLLAQSLIRRVSH
jgi:transposase-like protein